MNKQIFTFENITNLVTPIARKYGVKEIYSYSIGLSELKRVLTQIIYSLN